MTVRRKGWLALADGRHFEGRILGAERASTGEVVFTTGLTGYEEVLTDPSYRRQILVMTAAHIGNTGINREDEEGAAPQVAGFVLNASTLVSSSWRSEESLDAYLKRHGIAALCEVDTRALTRHLREHGSQMGSIGEGDVTALVTTAAAAPPMAGTELVSEVSTPEAYTWTEGSPASSSVDELYWYRSEKQGRGLKVVAFDFGVKRNILRRLVDVGCEVHVVPADTSAEAVRALAPDGIFLSNGPGDPAATTGPIATVKALLGYRPMFGICLGHQLMARACELPTYKLKFGHRGVNQPVRDEATGRIEITSQNHGFVVDTRDLPEGIEQSHVHLNDGTCEGLEFRRHNAFSVQYHPEAAAGPHDSTYLFDRFVERMRQSR